MKIRLIRRWLAPARRARAFGLNERPRRRLLERCLLLLLLVLGPTLVLEPALTPIADAASKKSSSKSSSKKSSSKSSSKKSSSKKSSSKKSSSKKSRRRGTNIVIEAPSSEKGSPPTEIVLPTRTADATTSKQATRAGVPRNPRIVSRQVRDLQPLPLEALASTREIGDYDWMPDGKRLLLVTDLSGVPNLWSIDASGAGWPQQLTFHEGRVSSPRVSPDGRFVAYAAVSPGSDLADVYLKPLPDGPPLNLSRTSDADEREAVWSPDGSQLAYTSDRETPGAYQIYVLDLKADGTPGAVKRVSRSVQSSIHPCWKPDGTFLMVSRFRTSSDSNLVMIDLHSALETVLTPHEGEQVWSGAGWSPDGTKVVATSDVEGAPNVAVLDVGTKAVTWVTRQSGEGLAQGWSPKEDRIAWISTTLGNQQIHSGAPVENARGATLRIRKGQISDARFSPDGRYLAFRYAGPTRAPDLWIYDLTRSVARQVTYALVSGVRAEHLVEPHLIHYQSFDGRFISGFLYVPHNTGIDVRRPAVVWVHDGPGRQQQNGFEPGIQVLVNRGYVVFAPNYRGSVGFGRAFEKLNDLDWGGGDLQDLVEAAGFLKGQSYIDAERVGILGAGYGGYLSLLAMVKTPDVWASGVALSSIPDLGRYYRTASPAERAVLRGEMGDPEKQEALWQTRSPAQLLPNLRAPLMLVHAAHERRVPASEVVTMAEAIDAQGVKVELVTVPGDRGLEGVRARATIYEKVAGFLEAQMPMAVPAVATPTGPAAGEGEATSAAGSTASTGATSPADGARMAGSAPAPPETSAGASSSGASSGNARPTGASSSGTPTHGTSSDPGSAPAPAPSPAPDADATRGSTAEGTGASNSLSPAHRDPAATTAPQLP